MSSTVVRAVSALVPLGGLALAEQVTAAPPPPPPGGTVRPDFDALANADGPGVVPLSGQDDWTFTGCNAPGLARGSFSTSFAGTPAPYHVESGPGVGADGSAMVDASFAFPTLTGLETRATVEADFVTPASRAQFALDRRRGD